MFFKIIFFILFCISANFLTVSAEPGVSAQSAIVMEQSTGRILYQKNAETKLPMASTTKIMTAVTALEKGEADADVKISDAAAATEGSSMYLEKGEKMNMTELLYGLMLASGNDAAVAIAEHFGGNDAFVKMMNEKAKEIGMINTNFVNPNGLPDENHYSTAQDMAKLAAYGLNDPRFLEIVSTKTYKISGEGKAYPRNLTNHNKLLNTCEGCIGIKTGFTKAAGRCLVSACRREGMTLICVTLNAPDDWNDHCNLYDSFFSKYKMEKIVQKGQCLGEVQVNNSETTILPVVAEKDFCYPLAEGEACTIREDMPISVEAPVDTGDACGEIKVMLSEKEIGTVNLILDGAAEKISVFQVLKENFKRNLGEIYWDWLTFIHSKD